MHSSYLYHKQESWFKLLNTPHLSSPPSPSPPPPPAVQSSGYHKTTTTSHCLSSPSQSDPKNSKAISSSSSPPATDNFSSMSAIRVDLSTAPSTLPPPQNPTSPIAVVADKEDSPPHTSEDSTQHNCTNPGSDGTDDELGTTKTDPDGSSLHLPVPVSSTDDEIDDIASESHQAEASPIADSDDCPPATSAQASASENDRPPLPRTTNDVNHASSLFNTKYARHKHGSKLGNLDDIAETRFEGSASVTEATGGRRMSVVYPRRSVNTELWTVAVFPM